jgi:hypothetical protein
MTRKPGSWRSGFTVSLLVALLLGCTGIREDELACEDAVSHLQACCPGFTGSNVDCTYEEGGCERSAVFPELNVNQSACIRNESCSELRATGVCARAAAMPSSRSWASGQAAGGYDDGGQEDPSARVCP